MTLPRGKTWPLSIAPMVDVTDRHFRFIMRQLTRETLLYTEMISTAAALHGDREKVMGFSAVEKPLAVQFGGDDPRDLAQCAQIAEQMGYDEVNLNAGCPSPRVQQGNFGACLMLRPERVAECVDAMRRSTQLPVTVKHRIGVNDDDSYEALHRFVQTVATAGCDRFTVHARKADLQGLSPAQNRTIPPLRYGDVHRLKRAFPQLRIEINGGFTSLDDAFLQLRLVDGVMIGRAAYETPYLFARADTLFFGNAPAALPRKRQLVEAVIPYLDRCVAQGINPHHITKHLLGLFHGNRGARDWKRRLVETRPYGQSAGEWLRSALAALE